MSPPSKTELPPSVKLPAPGLKSMPVKDVSAAKSLLVSRLVMPPNCSASGGLGAISPTQLAAVVQFPLPPPPSQVAAPVVLAKIQAPVTANNVHTHRVRNRISLCPVKQVITLIPNELISSRQCRGLFTLDSSSTNPTAISPLPTDKRARGRA